MSEQPFLWVMPSRKLMESLQRAHKGEDPGEIILDLWAERDPSASQIEVIHKEEA